MQNALHLVCDPTKAGTETDVQIAKLLIDSGCNFNHKDHQNHETPIFRALVANDFEVCKLLVVEGVDLSLRNAFGNDALSRSVQLGRFRIARFLTLSSLSFRAYSCVYKPPSAEESSQSVEAHMSEFEGDQQATNQFLTNESLLQYNLSKYEEFLRFLENHLRQPRRLSDLCRLNVRHYMRKPVSKWVGALQMPRQVEELIMLADLAELFSTKAK